MSVVAVLELLDPTGSTPSGRRWEISRPTIVGRGGRAAVVVAVDAVSRHHVELRPEPDGWLAADLDSRNGTFLNGSPLGAEPVRLADGDELVLAGSVALRFRDPLATPLAPRIGRLTGVWIDPETEAVWVDAKPLEPPLTDRQFRLLQRLYRAGDAVVARPELIAAAWPDASADGVTDEALTALLKRTRKRLAEIEQGRPVIEIVRHRGVRLRQG